MADTVVLIEGSLTPAAGYLKRGEQVEVTLTDNVKDLESKGFINFVIEVPQTPEPQPVAVPITPEVPGATPVTPEAPQGTNQDLAQATPVQAPDQTKPEVANPEVDNSLVDVNAKPADAKTATTSTAKK